MRWWYEWASERAGLSWSSWFDLTRRVAEKPRKGNLAHSTHKQYNALMTIHEACIWMIGADVWSPFFFASSLVSEWIRLIWVQFSLDSIWKRKKSSTCQLQAFHPRITPPTSTFIHSHNEIIIYYKLSCLISHRPSCSSLSLTHASTPLHSIPLISSHPISSYSNSFSSSMSSSPHSSNANAQAAAQSAERSVVLVTAGEKDTKRFDLTERGRKDWHWNLSRSSSALWINLSCFPHRHLLLIGFDHTIRFWEAPIGLCHRTLQYTDSVSQKR